MSPPIDLRARGRELVLVVLQAEHSALRDDPRSVGLSAPRTAVPITVRVAERVHQHRERRLGGSVSLWEVDLARRWFVLEAFRQRQVLLFSSSGGLELGGDLEPHTLRWHLPDARDWF